MLMPTPLRADCWVADTVGDGTKMWKLRSPDDLEARTRKGWSPQAADLNEGYFFCPPKFFVQCVEEAGFCSEVFYRKELS